MTNQRNRDHYYSVKELKTRGWNNRLIKQFLGKSEDNEVSFPKKRGRPQQLFCKEKVLYIEKYEDEFQSEHEKTSLLAETARIKNHHKTSIIESYIKTICIPNFNFSYSELLAKTSEKNIPLSRRNELALDYLIDTMKITINHLSLFNWHTGIRLGRILLKNKILQSIGNQFPELNLAIEKIKGGS